MALRLSTTFGRRVGALTAGISLAAAGLIVTGQPASAANGDPYYSTVIATPGFTTQGLTFDAAGTMYVANTSLGSIDRVNSNGTLTPVVNSGLQGASGVLADGDNGLYIADTNHSLLKYWDADTGVVSTLSSAVATPHGMAWGPDGDVYIADSINNRIAKWDPQTQTLSAAAYNLNYPSDVAVAANGDIYVADTSNHRIAYFPANNPFTPQTLVSNVSYPLAVTLDPAGNLFFADLSNQLVEERSASTGVVSTVWHTSNNIYGLRFGPDGGLYMTDSSQILELNPYGPPSSPLGATATPGDSSAELSFDVPTRDGGAAISGYEVSSDGGNTWTTATTTGSGRLTTTVSGLTNGLSYELSVRADNLNGFGDAATVAAVTPDVAPGAPTGLAAVAHGPGSIDLSFIAPTANNGSAITGYQASTDDGLTFSPLTVDESSAPFTATISGLTAGTGYAVQVRAVNAGGPGAVATANNVAATDVPSAPRLVAATPADGALDVEFQTPSSDGGLIISKYQSSLNGTTWTDLATTPGPSSGVLDATVSGLTNGTSYIVRVRAVNADGPGATGAASAATPVGAPAAPSILGQVTGNGSIQLSFSAPANNGSAITYYQVSVDGGANWNYALPYQDDPLTVNVSGLDNGTSYQLKLRALNDVGNGAVATASAATPSTTPDAPTTLTAVAGDASAQLSFDPPTVNGGASITSYQYTVDGGSTWHSLTVTGSGSAKRTATLPGLTNGVAYSLQVRAVNVQGGGTASQPASVTPVATAAVDISGPIAQIVGAGSRVTIAGTAPADATVRIYFHQRGRTGWILRRTLTASSTGNFSTTYLAGDDYRYYAQVGSTKSGSTLTQVAPTVGGALNRVVKKNSTVVLTGTGVAGSTVQIHFHKAGTAPTDFSTVRDVVVAANGTWTRSYLASVDYRLYVRSTLNSTASTKYLIQAR